VTLYLYNKKARHFSAPGFWIPAKTEITLI